jgi:hypothetical protein
MMSDKGRMFARHPNANGEIDYLLIQNGDSMPIPSESGPSESGPSESGPSESGPSDRDSHAIISAKIGTDAPRIIIPNASHTLETLQQPSNA